MSKAFSSLRRLNLQADMNDTPKISDDEILIIKKIEDSVLSLENLAHRLDTLICAISGIENQKDPDYFNNIMKGFEEKNENKK